MPASFIGAMKQFADCPISVHVGGITAEVNRFDHEMNLISSISRKLSFFRTGGLSRGLLLPLMQR
jgi:hypothetical protein